MDHSLESRVDGPQPRESRVDGPQPRDSRVDGPQPRESRVDGPQPRDSRVDGPQPRESPGDISQGVARVSFTVVIIFWATAAVGPSQCRRVFHKNDAGWFYLDRADRVGVGVTRQMTAMGLC